MINWNPNWNPWAIYYPGAEHLRQWIDTRWWSPSVTVNYAGNPVIEQDVTDEVASFGRQIGWLNEIVLALVDRSDIPVQPHSELGHALTKFREAQKTIAGIKKRRRKNALDDAREALAKLCTMDKPAYANLVRGLDPDKPPTRS